MSKNRAIINTINVSKHKKSKGPFFQNSKIWVYLKI